MHFEATVVNSGNALDLELTTPTTEETKSWNLVEKEEFYAAFHDQGLHYGPAF